MAEWKAKEGELTAADLLTFGVLPPEGEKTDAEKRQELETLDKADTVPCEE